MRDTSRVETSTPELRDETDASLIADAARQLEPSFDGLVAVWVKQDTVAADYIRAEEARQFPEVPDLLTEDVEQQCMFLAMVEVESGQVVHATRISGPFIRQANGAITHGSGFVIVDEVIAETESFTVEDFLRSYPESTLAISMSIETNFRIGERRRLTSGVRVAHLGYLTLFRLLERLRPDGAESLVFGSHNEATIRSLTALGMPGRPLAGIPQQRAGESDDDYRPMVISITDEARPLFRAMDSVALPETWLGDPAWAGAALGLPQVVAQRTR